VNRLKINLLLLLLLLLACSGCSADTSYLMKPVDITPWLRPEGGEALVDPALLTPIIPSEPSSDPTGSEEAPNSDVTGAHAAGQSHPIDLAAVLKLAGSGAVEIDLARSRAKEAAHEAKVQQAQALPFLTPRARFFRHEGYNQNNRGLMFDVDRQTATAGAGADLVLQPSEAIYRSLAAAQRASAASASYRARVDATLVRAARTYFALATSAAQQAIAGDDLRAAQELLRIEQARETAGVSLPASVARARARLAEAEGRLQAAIGEVTGNSAELAGLLNLRTAAQLTPQIAKQSNEGLIALALHLNPELQAATSRIAAAASEADLTRWGWLLPELRAGVTLDEFGSTFGNTNDRENYYAGVSWRLDFGMTARHSANVERQRQAELQATNVRNQLVTTIHRLRAQIKTAAARVDAGRREVEAASESLRLVTAQHTQGAGLLLQVLDAQAAQSRARINLLAAVGSHNVAQYSLLRATGGSR
jgi:multidrug efflux system outer membrane protein